EFKPPALPGLVFWPGFDPEFLRQAAAAGASQNRFGAADGDPILVYNGNIHETNTPEVRSLFLAVQALRRCGRRVTILKTGRNSLSDQRWIQEPIDAAAGSALGFVGQKKV